VAPTVLDPAAFVVLRVIHHLQDVDDALGVVHAADQPKAIVAHVEDDAVADLIGCPECLLERPEV
jgi:hypothetical protein